VSCEVSGDVGERWVRRLGGGGRTAYCTCFSQPKPSTGVSSAQYSLHGEVVMGRNRGHPTHTTHLLYDTLPAHVHK